MSDYAKIGKVVPLHRGSYDAGTEYRINDVVEYQKSTYWHKGIEATTGVPPTDEAVWELMLSFHASVDPLLQDIEDKGAETLAKIPENYADLDALAKRNEEGIGELKDDLDKLDNAIYFDNPNLLTTIKETAYIGKYVDNENGNEYSNSSFSCTGFIKVEPNTTYNFFKILNVNKLNPVSNNKGAIYDSNKNYVAPLTYTNYQFTTPENGYYIRYSVNSSSGVSFVSSYLGTEDIGVAIVSSQWLRKKPSDCEVKKEFPINLLQKDVYETGRLKDAQPKGIAYTYDEIHDSTSGYKVSGFTEIDTNEGKLYAGIYYNGTWKENTTVCLGFFDDDYRFISAVIPKVDGIDIPKSAKYIIYHSANVYYPLSVISHKPLGTSYVNNDGYKYSADGNHFLYEEDNPWYGKTWSAYGDSITDISGGNGLNIGWAKYVNQNIPFSMFYGRGIGGQRYVWGNGGGAVSFIDDTGVCVNRNDSYTKDNYTGDVPEGTVACRSSLCSWDRIVHMYPDSIKDTIDLIVVMGVNDGGAQTQVITDIPQFISGATTDTEWTNAEENTLGGDFDVTTLNGAVASTLLKLQTRCSNALIVICSGWSGLGTGSSSVDTADYGNGGKGVWYEGQTIRNVANYFSFNFFDLWGSTQVNPWNHTKYITDGTHPYNDDGKKALARAYTDAIKRLTPRNY